MPEHLGPKDSTGCEISRDLPVSDWRHLRITLPRIYDQDTLHCLKVIFSYSTNKCLNTLRALHPRFMGPYSNLGLCIISKRLLSWIFRDRLLFHKIWDKIAISMESAKEVVSYPTWTLLPNSNSIKISLKPMRSKTQTPNPIMLQAILQ